MKKQFISYVLFLILAIIPSLQQARTKMVTLPGREVSFLNLDHFFQNLAMEERYITLEKGLTTIAFSWQGVNIDPNSIQLQPAEHPDKVKLINVSYPPGENALEWKVASPEAAKERFRIYYLISGIGRSISYKMDVSADEKTASLKVYYELSNNSGEDFNKTITYTGLGQGVVKNMENGSALKVLVAEFPQIPVKKVYICNTAANPEKVSFYYEVKNEEEMGLGKFKLPAGKIRIYQATSARDAVFLGEDWLKDVAVKEKQNVYLGDARDVTVKRKLMDDRRENIRRNNNKDIVLFDQVLHLRYEIQNFKKEPLELKIEETMSDYWDVEELSGPEARHNRKDNSHLEVFLMLPPEGKKIESDLTIRKINQLAQ